MHSSSEPQIVFEPDTRKRVADSRRKPYGWVGRLYSTFPDGSIYTGTGTLFEGNKVVTCAHNLYDRHRRTYAESVDFVLAENGQGGLPTRGTRLDVAEMYTLLPSAGPDQTFWQYDYGQVTLAGSLEPFDGLYPALFAADDDILATAWCEVAGYPGDKPDGTMWDDGGTVLEPLVETLLFYRISTFAGESGAAVRTTLRNVVHPDVPRIVGIHVAGSAAYHANYAVRMTDEVVDEVMTWG